MISAKYSKRVLVRGCDPVRAAFAKKNWEPLVQAEIDSATSDEELMKYLTSENRYDVFFLAPGMCSLVKSGRVNGKQLKEQVLTYQPQAKVVNCEDVSQAVPLLTAALELDARSVKTVTANSVDWPFVD